MGKFTRNRVDSPEYAKNPDDNFFATYFRRVVLTYMESESECSLQLVQMETPELFLIAKFEPFFSQSKEREFLIMIVFLFLSSKFSPKRWYE